MMDSDAVHVARIFPHLLRTFLERNVLDLGNGVDRAADTPTVRKALLLAFTREIRAVGL